ncbi:MAG TPA: ABC transporter substrate-binding protein [Falsiroseomonas sp.]|jgi:NitT/TauT family transport system substrate-binding protein|nr:ABC transporter substrate-binding protein [Falsiroseomonas sp.]
MFRRHLIAAAGALLAAPRLAAAQGAQRRATIAMDWALQGVTAPWTMAEDRGWFREAGADIAVTRGFGSGDTVVKVASGAVELGYADVYTLMRFLAQNPAQRMVAFFMVHDRSALSLAVMADSPIRQPADFAGKTLAAPPGDASRSVFPLFAQKSGFEPSAVRWLDVSADLREAMLLRRQADGISGHVTTVAMNIRGAGLPRDAVRFFPYSDFGVPLYGHVLFATTAFAEANAPVLTGCIKGTVRGLRAMIADPRAAAEAAKRREPLLEVDIEAERIRIANEMMFVTPHVRANGFSAVEMDRLDSTMKEVGQAFGIADPPPASQLYTTRYLPPRPDLAFAAS